jgi:hypothetical protein
MENEVKRGRGRPRIHPVAPPKPPPLTDNDGRPKCSECGQFHWRFVKCQNAATQKDREVKAQAARQPITFYRTLSPGLPNKLINYREVAPGVFVRKDSPLQRG